MPFQNKMEMFSNKKKLKIFEKIFFYYSTLLYISFITNFKNTTMDVLQDNNNVLQLALSRINGFESVTRTDVLRQLDTTKPHHVLMNDDIEITAGFGRDTTEGDIVCFVESAHYETGYLAIAQDFNEAQAWFVDHFVA